MSDTVASTVAENVFLQYNMPSDLDGFPRLTCKGCLVFKKEVRAWRKVGVRGVWADRQHHRVGEQLGPKHSPFGQEVEGKDLRPSVLMEDTG